MKAVQLKSLSIKNFKGIKSLDIKELGRETNIFGDNATGKTSIFDAFTWLLFNKESSDRASFEIKPLDVNNNVIPKTENEVSGVLSIDGNDIPIRKVHKENWVKKRGALESEFTGNQTLYYWDDVPVKKNEYESNIKEIVDEDVFKLITSPTAFNSLKWQDQRETLVSLTDITDQSIAKDNKEFTELLSKLSKTKTIDLYEKQIKSSIRDSKKQIEQLPTRIDEVERGKPEALDFKVIVGQLEQANSDKLDLDKQISSTLEADKSILEKKKALQNKTFEIESNISKLKNNLKDESVNKAREANKESEDLKQTIKESNESIERYNKAIEKLNKQLNDLTDEYKKTTDILNEIRDEWKKTNSTVFELDSSSTSCPCCSRELEEDKANEIIEEAKLNFLEAKKRDLKYLDERGSRQNNRKKQIESEFEQIEKRIINGEDKVSELEESKKIDTEELNSTCLQNPDDLYKEALESNFEVKVLVKQLAATNSELINIKEADVSELKDQSNELACLIDELKSKLAVKEVIAQSDKRIKEIESEEGKLAQVIASYEKELFVIDKFIAEKINRLESAINDKFSFVKFKLFEKQVNGSEVPTCKAMVNGVPYSDVNTAGRINAGLDIIKTLSDHYGVQAPIFIDNRESIVELLNMDSQIINLIVSKPDKVLRVENK